MYIELHARSAFSFLEGASLPELLMARCAELDMPAMALLDRNGLYGAPRLHMAAQRAGTRAHIGAEIAVRDAGERLRPPQWLPHRIPAEPVRLALLAETQIGYQNLCRLITRFKLREPHKTEGSAMFSEIAGHADGLVCLTGGDEGPLAAALARGGYDAALHEVERLVSIVGPRNVYVELQRHFDRDEEHRNQVAVRIARALNLPLLATNGVNYATPYEREVLDVLTTIRHHCTLETAGRLLTRNSERYLRSSREMQQLFRDLPEAIVNTGELSSRLNFEMSNLGYRFPDIRMAMIVANFTGGEAEELRRAVGMRRSMQRMKNLEGRLRDGMTRNGIGPEAQDNIVQGISSFAMYGFPESHAASFALIAYASAYLKVHYLAAFTCGLLNNQPMGFYSPAVLIKDAQRHGLRVRPICVLRSEWLCTLEEEPDRSLSLRIGLSYVKGLRQSSADALLAARGKHAAFATVDALAQQVPELNRKELVALASVGALNSMENVDHRRDALWQVEQAGRPIGPLLRAAADASTQAAKSTPLRQMTDDERLAADYAGTGITTGPHPMAYERERLRRQGILSALELERGGGNRPVCVAGRVIARQRPSTAKGFVFLSLEDETGIANVILTPDIFEENRLIVTRSRFLTIEGKLQNQEGVIHVKAERIALLRLWPRDFVRGD